MELFFWGTIVSKVWTFAHRELDLLQNRNVGLNVGLPTVVIYFLYWQRSHFIATQKSSSPYSIMRNSEWNKSTTKTAKHSFLTNEWQAGVAKSDMSRQLSTGMFYSVYSMCMFIFFFFVIIILMSLCSAWESAAKNHPALMKSWLQCCPSFPPNSAASGTLINDQVKNVFIFWLWAPPLLSSVKPFDFWDNRAEFHAKVYLWERTGEDLIGNGRDADLQLCCQRRQWSSIISIRAY